MREEKASCFSGCENDVFAGLDAPDQLKLLLSNEYYELSRSQIASQLKWEAFSPDELIGILRYHPELGSFFSDREWSQASRAGKEAWYTYFLHHHSYSDRCPAETFGRFTPEERYLLACAAPGIASHLALNTLSQEQQEALLQKHPELAGYFTFDPADPPEKVCLSHLLDSCTREEARKAGAFLAELLPCLSEKEAAEIVYDGEGVLGVYPRSQAEVLEQRIKSFTEENGISSAAMFCCRIPLEWPLFVPADNLECAILAENRCLTVQACLEEEKLSRADILLTKEFCDLRYDVSTLVLMKALSGELRDAVLKLLWGSDASFMSINQLEAVRRICRKTFAHSRKDEQLLEAAEKEDFDQVRTLAGKSFFDHLSAAEALKLYRVLPDSLARFVFGRSLTPLLRAYLVTELTQGAHDSDVIGLVNLLIRPYWRETIYEDDEFEIFSAEEEGME